MNGADDKNTITREDINLEIKKAKKDKVKLIAYLYIFSYGKEEFRRYLLDFVEILKCDTVAMLKKVIAV